MTAKITADGLDLCVDCISLITNGTLGNGDEQADNEHAAKISAGWPDDTLVMACDEDCDGHFSWQPCDGCGSTLGGDRHPAVAFAKP